MTVHEHTLTPKLKCGGNAGENAGEMRGKCGGKCGGNAGENAGENAGDRPDGTLQSVAFEFYKFGF